jgi:anti-sigma regulatory factor (Ser/Thr protein kinase)
MTSPTLSTSTPTPSKPHSSYRHEAVLYRGDDDFLAATAPFVREGIAADQPVMVAVIGRRAEGLRDMLGSDADEVHFVDMAELGHNPARIIPGWRRFIDEHFGEDGASRPTRGIGEPIWLGRRGPEVVESQLHEALLNLAVEPDTPLWLRCPYDVDALPAAVVNEAHRSHPVLVEAGEYRGSLHYGGASHVGDFFERDLPPAPAVADVLVFGAGDLAAVRWLVTDRARTAGLDAERAWELALAVHEVASNSIANGGGKGRLLVWREPEALISEVRDSGRLDDPMVGRRAPAPTGEDGRGLWLANQLCDLVQVRSTRAGAVVRLVSWL